MAGDGITSGFDRFVQRLAGAETKMAIDEMAMIRSELAADPAATVAFGTDGVPLFSSDTRTNMPAAAVQQSRSVAGGAKGALNKYEFTAEARDQANQALGSRAKSATEKAYAKAIAAGESPDKAKARASKAGNSELSEGSLEIANAGAVDRLHAAKQDGTVFDPGIDGQTKAVISDYNSGNAGVGDRARALAGNLPTNEAAFLRFMANEVTLHGAIESQATIRAPTKNMPPGAPTTQVMRRWEYADGTLVRYKELGDNYRPNAPSLSIEVKKNAAVSDSSGGADAIAFKLDSQGQPAPKGDRDLHNPYRNREQKDTFEDTAMQAVHVELTK